MIWLVIALSILLRFFWLGSYDLLVEEAYYWNYAQHLDWSYLDHPPMVAVLIRLSTSIFGNNEWAIRLPAFLCFFPTAYFSYALTNLIKPYAGWYSVLLLSILPFFFIQSIVITPDQPLILCWAAALYYLYRALANCPVSPTCRDSFVASGLDPTDKPREVDKNVSRNWYVAGLWIGLGLLSKYTIVLLGLATLLYLLLVPNARFWWKRKEPYLCAFLALICFIPVIYWNMQHEWASFIFQGSRRFQASFYFSFHYIVGLLFLFLLPVGVLGLWQLAITKDKQPNYVRFLQIFTFTPLLVFTIFSFTHEVKFNWIGPGLLAVIPWLALLTASKRWEKIWIVSGILLLLIYNGILLIITTGQPAFLYKKFLHKFINWEGFVLKLNHIAANTLNTTHQTPVLVPLDLYNIQSELAFYQTKLLAEHKINTAFPTIGRHIFNKDSLMYRYWQPSELAHNTTMILISKDKELLTTFGRATNCRLGLGPTKALWAQSQGSGVDAIPFYYLVMPYNAAILIEYK